MMLQMKLEVNSSRYARRENPGLLLAHTNSSPGTMLFQVKCFEEIPNLPICIPTIFQASTVYLHLPPARSLLPRPNVVPLLQYTYYAES